MIEGMERNGTFSMLQIYHLMKDLSNITILICAFMRGSWGVHEGFFHKNNLVQPQTLAPPNIWNYGNICTISNVVFSAVVFSFSTDFFSVSYCVKFSYNTYLLKNVEKIKIDKFRLNLSLWKEIFLRNPLNEP